MPNYAALAWPALLCFFFFFNPFNGKACNKMANSGVALQLNSAWVVAVHQKLAFTSFMFFLNKSHLSCRKRSSQIFQQYGCIVLSVLIPRTDFFANSLQRFTAVTHKLSFLKCLKFLISFLGNSLNDSWMNSSAFDFLRKHNSTQQPRYAWSYQRIRKDQGRRNSSENFKLLLLLLFSFFLNLGIPKVCLIDFLFNTPALGTQ